jgi:hypothetical protein
MTTECYAMVRGSAIRVTELGKRGQIPDTIRFATSKSVAKVVINEVVESGGNERLDSDTDDNTPRLRLAKSDQTIQYKADIDFLRVDPGVLSLVAGVPLVYDSGGGGFGGDAFGEDPFGGVVGNVVGFDSKTRMLPVSFALEVWTKLAGNPCAGGQRQYGYTLFPFLKGGYLSGVTFANGLVSFNLRGAQTRRVSRWGVGPFDLEGPYERLTTDVSRNTLFRQLLTTAPPPTEVCGIQETTDVLEGGTATMTTPDVVDGEFVDTSPWIVEGGMAV